MKVDDDVDGEGRVSPAGVGPGEGRLRPGGGRVPAAHSSRVQRLLVLAYRAPGRPDQTPVEGGDGIQGLWINAQSFIVWHCIKPILGHFDKEILRSDSNLVKHYWGALHKISRFEFVPTVGTNLGGRYVFKRPIEKCTIGYKK